MRGQKQPKENARVVSIKVVLVRPLFGPREWFIPPGSTVGELLERAHASALNHEIMIGRRVVDPSHPLKKGSVVHLVPRARGAIDPLSWRDTVGMFRDDPAFDDMVEAGRAIREADRASSQDED
jgi:hypothetical protein